MQAIENLPALVAIDADSVEARLDVAGEKLAGLRIERRLVFQLIRSVDPAGLIASADDQCLPGRLPDVLKLG